MVHDEMHFPPSLFMELLYNMLQIAFKFTFQNIT